jgi:uncharacterized Zn-binding protein involved in type VI secretion
MRSHIFLTIALACAASWASAQTTTPASGRADSGPVVGGSPDVSVSGAAAARQGDAAQSGAPLIQGSPDVFINGRPAATMGGGTACGGVVVGGSAHVLVNGKPLARAGDPATGCARN